MIRAANAIKEIFSSTEKTPVKETKTAAKHQLLNLRQRKNRQGHLLSPTQKKMFVPPWPQNPVQASGKK
jgi:hypothetical protein